MKTITLALALLAVSVPAFAEKAIPLSRIESVFQSKINKTEQMVKLCKALQSCGQPLKDARMETQIMKQKYTEAGGTDTALINRAGAAINEAQQVED